MSQRVIIRVRSSSFESRYSPALPSHNIIHLHMCMHHLSAELPFPNATKGQRAISQSVTVPGETTCSCTLSYASLVRFTKNSKHNWNWSRINQYDMSLCFRFNPATRHFNARRCGLQRCWRCTGRFSVNIDAHWFCLTCHQYRVSFSLWGNGYFLLKHYKSNCAWLLWNTADGSFQTGAESDFLSALFTYEVQQIFRCLGSRLTTEAYCSKYL